jgi:hypothetical protein
MQRKTTENKVEMEEEPEPILKFGDSRIGSSTYKAYVYSEVLITRAARNAKVLSRLF